MFIVAFFFSLLRKRRVERRGQMSESTLHEWRTRLVGEVGERSRTKGASVNLRGFWHRSGLTRPQRYVILSDLLKRQILYPAYSSDGILRFFENVWWHWLHLPVGAVRLSDLDWLAVGLGTVGLVRCERR